MAETKIKVCGLTSSKDALLCAGLGIDFIGLNFSPRSERCITAAKAHEIVTAVRAEFPGTKFIGVFVDQSLEFVQEVVDEPRLDGVQLHGNETPEFVSKVRAPFVIKALRITPNFRLTPKAFASEANSYACDAILLDTWSANRAGGTGETFDWSIAAEIRPRVGKLILAGGLRPENVATAIKIVQPFAVDVCSGVEDAVGKKSEDKVRRFIEAVRRQHESAIAT